MKGGLGGRTSGKVGPRAQGGRGSGGVHELSPGPSSLFRRRRARHQ